MGCPPFSALNFKITEHRLMKNNKNVVLLPVFKSTAYIKSIIKAIKSDAKIGTHSAMSYALINQI